MRRELSGPTNSEIGNIFGMNYSAVSKAAIDIENGMKEDKALRKEVARLISNFEA